MSTINVNAIDKESGSTLSLGTSGTTVDIPSGATLDVTGATVTGLSAGKVLQVVSSMMTGTSTTTSTSLVTTGLEGTITPSATSSKILISISFALAAAGGDAGPHIQLFKGSSVISGSLADVQGSRRQSSVGMRYNAEQSTAFNYLDSPSTTSATTYKLMFACGQAGQDIYLNLVGTGSSTLYYTSPATMILMEIAG